MGGVKIYLYIEDVSNVDTLYVYINEKPHTMCEAGGHEITNSDWLDGFCHVESRRMIATESSESIHIGAATPRAGCHVCDTTLKVPKLHDAI